MWQKQQEKARLNLDKNGHIQSSHTGLAINTFNVVKKNV